MIKVRFFICVLLALPCIAFATGRPNILLLMAEQVSVRHGQPTFLATAFEVISAFSTVGLSTGITDTLSDPGKLLLVSTMFIGRIGPLVLVTLLIRRRHGPAVTHPVGEVHIG